MAASMLSSYFSFLAVIFVSFFLGNLFFNLLFYKKQKEKDSKANPKIWIFSYRSFFRDRLVFFDEISRFYLGFFLLNLFCFISAEGFSNVRIGVYFVFVLSLILSIISLIVILKEFRAQGHYCDQRGQILNGNAKDKRNESVPSKCSSFSSKPFKATNSKDVFLNTLIILSFVIASVIILNIFFFNYSSGEYRLFHYAWADFGVHTSFTQSFVYSNNINPIITPFYSGAEFFYPPMADFNSAVFQILGIRYVDSYVLSEILIFFGLFYYLFCLLKIFISSKWAVYGVIAILFFPGLFFLFGNGMQTIYSATEEFLNVDLNAGKELLATGYEGDPRANSIGIENIGVLFYCIMIPQKTFAFGFSFFLVLFCLFLYSREKNFSLSNLKIRRFRFKEITKGLFSEIDFRAFLLGAILGSIGLFHAHILLCIGIILFLLVLIFDDKDIRDLFFGLLFSAVAFSMKTIFFSVSNKSYIRPYILVNAMGEAKGIFATLSKIFLGQNLLIPLLLFVFLLFSLFKSSKRMDIDERRLFRNAMILFFIVSVPIVVANFVIFSPYWYDNGKVHHFIFTFYFCFLLFFIYRMKSKRLLKAIFAISMILIYLICYVVIFDYMLSNRYGFINKSEIEKGIILGERLDGVYALPNFGYLSDSILSNSAGLICYMGYEGHVWSHGYETLRKGNVEKIYYSKDLDTVCDIVLNERIDYIIFRENNINDELRESFLFYIDNFEIVYADSAMLNGIKEMAKRHKDYIEEIKLEMNENDKPPFNNGLIIFEVFEGCKNTR